MDKILKLFLVIIFGVIAFFLLMKVFVFIFLVIQNVR